MGNGQNTDGLDFTADAVAALGGWYYVLWGMAVLAVILLLVGLPWLLWRYEQMCRRLADTDQPPEVS